MRPRTRASVHGWSRPRGVQDTDEEGEGPCGQSGEIHDFWVPNSCDPPPLPDKMKPLVKGQLHGDPHLLNIPLDLIGAHSASLSLHTQPLCSTCMS